jgi:hypothetical protein
MTLTTQDKDVLRILVEKELEHVKKDTKSFFTSNSPFLMKIGRDEADLPFLKSGEAYIHFLEQLLERLSQ